MSCSELYVDHPLWFLKHVAVAQCPCFAAEGSGAQRSEGDSAREPGHSLAVCGLTHRTSCAPAGGVRPTLHVVRFSVRLLGVSLDVLIKRFYGPTSFYSLSSLCLSHLRRRGVASMTVWSFDTWRPMETDVPIAVGRYTQDRTFISAQLYFFSLHLVHPPASDTVLSTTCGGSRVQGACMGHDHIIPGSSSSL